jgi:hypothetical protein
MDGYSFSFVNVSDPYAFLALNVLHEAFRNIECYFSREGSEEEIKEGRYSLNWIRKMRGNFRLIAMAVDIPLPEFHQMCLWKINQIKANAHANIGLEPKN